MTKILVPISFYCLKCTKFGQLILSKNIKIVANRCKIIGLKCIKFDFGFPWALAPRPLAEFKGPNSKGRGEGEGDGKERKRERKAERERGHPRFLPGLTLLAVADNRSQINLGIYSIRCNDFLVYVLKRL